MGGWFVYLPLSPLSENCMACVCGRWRRGQRSSCNTFVTKEKKKEEAASLCGFTREDLKSSGQEITPRYGKTWNSLCESRQAPVFDVSPALFRKRRERGQFQVEANKLWGENRSLYSKKWNI